MGANYLDVLAHDLLDAALDGLAPARTGRAAPGRAAVTHGRPAVDVCEGEPDFLCVYLDMGRALTFQSQPDRPRVPRLQLAVPIALFNIELWRCTPAFTAGGQVPSAAQIDAEATALLVDLWCVQTQLVDEQAAATLVTVGCRSVELLGAQVLGPQGSAAGWLLPVRVALSDRGPVAP